MFTYIVLAAAVIIFLRIVLGPTFADRVIAADLLVNLIILLMVLQSIALQSQLYLDVAIVFAVLTFAGTMSIAKWVVKR
jgi:multicomponent Na+:H+ antiporter subunit F